MPPEKNNSAYLWDMLEAVKLIIQFTEGISQEKYLLDRKLQLAVERALEIMGEAARHVTADFQTSHREIPWKKVIGQGNILAHEYGEIRQERIWAVITSHIPALKKNLEPLIPKIR